MPAPLPIPAKLQSLAEELRLLGCSVTVTIHQEPIVGYLGAAHISESVTFTASGTFSREKDSSVDQAQKASA